MNGRVQKTLAVLLVLLAWFAGLKSGERNAVTHPTGLPAPGLPGTPVARFDGVSISGEELRAQIEGQAPYVRSRFSTAQGKREFLDGMLNLELMARAALKKGYQEDPDVLMQYKRALAAAFVQHEFDEVQDRLPLADAEVERYYEAHRDEFVKPEQVRLATMFFAAPAGSSGREQQRAAAQAAFAARDQSDPFESDPLVEVVPATDGRRLEKDLGLLSRERLVSRIGAEAAEVAFGMGEIGATHPGVVETERGFYLLKLLGRENASELKLAAVTDTIRSRLLFEKRSQAFDEFLGGIRKEAGLAIDDKVLDGLQIATGLPPGAPPLAPPVAARRAPPVPVPAAAAPVPVPPAQNQE